MRVKAPRYLPVEKGYITWGITRILLNLLIQTIQEAVDLVPEFLSLWTCHDFLVFAQLDQSLDLRGLGKALDTVCDTDVGIGLRGQIFDCALQRFQKFRLRPLLACCALLPLRCESMRHA